MLLHFTGVFGVLKLKHVNTEENFIGRLEVDSSFYCEGAGKGCFSSFLYFRTIQQEARSASKGFIPNQGYRDGVHR